MIQVESDALFGRAHPRLPRGDDLDGRIAALHYREVVEWAVGHGIAAEPVVEPDGRVRRVRTTRMPAIEVEPVVPRANLPGEFAAAALGALAPEKVAAALGYAAATPYLTALCYFNNALRELGSARRIVEGEILAGVERYGSRDHAGRRLLADRRQLGEPLELTSRVGTAEIAEARRRLGTAFGAEGFVDVALATKWTWRSPPT